MTDRARGFDIGEPISALIHPGIHFSIAFFQCIRESIQNEFDEIALALIAAKADPNLTGKFSSPPLKLAVTKERHAVIRALIDAGATPL